MTNIRTYNIIRTLVPQVLTIRHLGISFRNIKLQRQIRTCVQSYNGIGITSSFNVNSNSTNGKTFYFNIKFSLKLPLYPTLCFVFHQNTMIVFYNLFLFYSCLIGLHLILVVCKIFFLKNYPLKLEH